METSTETAQRTVLSIACGQKGAPIDKEFANEDEWNLVRVDGDPAVEPDVLADMRELQCFEDDYADAVWCKSALDHLYDHEVPEVLEGFYRILKPGGFALIVTLDAQQTFRAVVEGNIHGKIYQSPAGPVAPLDQIFGFRPDVSRGNRFLEKHTAFTRNYMRDLLESAGFKAHVYPDTNYMQYGLTSVGIKS